MLTSLFTYYILAYSCQNVKAESKEEGILLKFDEYSESIQFVVNKTVRFIKDIKTIITKFHFDKYVMSERRSYYNELLTPESLNQ